MASLGKQRRKRRHFRRKQFGVAAGRCYYCRAPFNDMDPLSDYYPTRDHKIPKSRGGPGTRDNIVMACRGCNQQKGDMTAAEFKAVLCVGVV